MAPRALTQLFNEINARIEFEFRVSCTYMEIYNERIYDLLSDLSNPDQASDYTIAEERDGRGTFVRGLTEIEVSNETEALNLLFSGELARTTATHKLNRRSNRSHSLFTIYLQQRQRSGVSERIVHSKLHLIDLAGSERLKKTMESSDGRVGDEVTRKESMCINQSLSFLEQCVVALARKGQSHIPYRQSKLTNILKDCLGANCNTLMIACMWGEADHLEETISTLRLASRMMRVQNETTKVETIDSSTLIKKQEKLIKALKQELLMHDALVERTGVIYEPYTPEQQTKICEKLEIYVSAQEIDEEDILQIGSFREMLEVCKQFKKMVILARSEVFATKERLVARGVDTRTESNGRPMSMNGVDYDIENRIADDYDPHKSTVGEHLLGPVGGFVLGSASFDARPPVSLDSGAGLKFGSSPSPQFHPKVKQTVSVCEEREKCVIEFPGHTISYGTEEDLDKNRGALFTTFVQGEGSETYQEFVHSKAYLKELRQKIKESGSNVNNSKATIDDLLRQVESRKSSRIELLKKSGLRASDTEDIVDEEEFRLMKELREAKRSYKNAYEQLQKLKQSSTQIQGDVDHFKSILTTSFAVWARGQERSERLDPGKIVDQLDDQEAFDHMEEERVMANDPESLSFFHAQKTRRALMTQNNGSLKHIQKNKRMN